MSFDREALKRKLAGLAARNIFLGTSSWKYSGWCGLLYDESRYLWRGKFAEKRFEQRCLAEYAEVFKTVCVDAAYYRFPDQRHLENLVAQVPEDFRFSLKVTDDVFLARIYAAALEIFRGGTWRRGIDRKLAILRDSYGMLNAESQARRAEMLEIIIVLLIGFEILLTLLGR